MADPQQTTVPGRAPVKHTFPDPSLTMVEFGDALALEIVDPAPFQTPVLDFGFAYLRGSPFVRELVALRRQHPELQGHAATTVVHAGYPFAWLRGEDYLVVVNPRREAAAIGTTAGTGMTRIFGSGAELTEGGVEVEGFGYGIFAR